MTNHRRPTFGYDHLGPGLPVPADDDGEPQSLADAWADHRASRADDDLTFHRFAAAWRASRSWRNVAAGAVRPGTDDGA